MFGAAKRRKTVARQGVGQCSSVEDAVLALALSPREWETYHFSNSVCRYNMRILLTNDDGIYAPGLESLHDELQRLGSVDVVAPSVEQSGVSHSITYLEPLLAHEVFRNGRLGKAERVDQIANGAVFSVD